MIVDMLKFVRSNIVKGTAPTCFPIILFLAYLLAFCYVFPTGKIFAYFIYRILMSDAQLHQPLTPLLEEPRCRRNKNILSIFLHKVRLLNSPANTQGLSGWSATGQFANLHFCLSFGCMIVYSLVKSVGFCGKNNKNKFCLRSFVKNF